MSALMLEGTSRSSVRPRVARALRPSVDAPRRESQRTPLGPTGATPPVVHWARVPGYACGAVAPVAVVAGSEAAMAAPAQAEVPTRLVWTPRGTAVMVVAVALLALMMLVTLVSAFLAVSNDPLPVNPAPAAVALADLAPGGEGLS